MSTHRENSSGVGVCGTARYLVRRRPQTGRGAAKPTIRKGEDVGSLERGWAAERISSRGVPRPRPRFHLEARSTRIPGEELEKKHTPAPPGCVINRADHGWQDPTALVERPLRSHLG